MSKTVADNMQLHERTHMFIESWVKFRACSLLFQRLPHMSLSLRHDGQPDTFRLERAYTVTMRFGHFHPEIKSTLAFCSCACNLLGELLKTFLSPACDPAHNALDLHTPEEGLVATQRPLRQHCAISPNRLAD